MNYQLLCKSPLGFLILKSDGLSITEISFSENELAEENPCELLSRCKQQLEDYFSGKSTSFDVPLNPNGTEFQKKVWTELQKIPNGETITYAQLAARLGDPKLVRAVGTANGRNPLAIVIPCHRVIGAGNKLTGYAGGLERKQWLLEHEMRINPSKQTLF
ncbi:MAG TPA: methylated-DNA--[protein]-cysteine S-methyltransferase [Prolixibacteraceae bacterium]